MIIDDITYLSTESHKIVTCKCDLRISENCYQVYKRAYRDVKKTLDRNNGNIICLPCSRALKASGRNNPNAKYNLDDNFFSDVNSEAKAYLLGWIASDGHISKSGFTINIHEKDLLCLKILRDIILPSLLIKTYKSNMIDLSVFSKQISIDLCQLLKIKPGKKSNTVRFPELKDDNLKWAFLRGYFDGDGTIRHIHSQSPECSITSNSAAMLSDIQNFVKIPCNINQNVIRWTGLNMIDFLGKLYDNATVYLSRKRDLYLDWANWTPSLIGFGNYGNCPYFKWSKTDSRAVIPSKANSSDAGYDLTIIDKYKEFGEVTLYTTGIKISPIQGYYMLIAPRSSISKTAYMLANSIGYIDQSYRGPILVALRKLDKNMPDIELPCKIAQLIPQKQIHMEIIEVDSLDEEETIRHKKRQT
jgi:deoxyuridine 5'-triphosphate nucleotidohydrolase